MILLEHFTNYYKTRNLYSITLKFDTNKQYIMANFPYQVLLEFDKYLGCYE